MNIILINTHDTGRYISPYGYPAKTHNFQKLSNIGYTYRNAFTVAPTCSPSRSALMTGLYPHQNGMFGLAHRGSKLNDYNLHISNFLKSKNFETALFGIQHEISYENIAKLGYKHIEINKISSKIGITASNWIKKYNSSNPLFISIGFYDTHREYPNEINNEFDPRWIKPPEIFFDNLELRIDMAKFYSALKEVDNAIGKILISLDERSLLNNTLIIATTDHGIAWPGMKCNLNDHGTGIFLVAYMKDYLDGGIISDELVSNTDIFSTICQFFNFKKPDYLDQFILPNNKIQFKKRNFVFSEINIHASIEISRSIRSKRFRYVERISDRKKNNISNIDNCSAKTFLINNDLMSVNKTSIEFYDLFNDPLERVNLGYEKFKYDLETHQSKLYEWRVKSNDPLLKRSFKWPSGIKLTDPDEANPNIISGCTE